MKVKKYFDYIVGISQITCTIVTIIGVKQIYNFVIDVHSVVRELYERQHNDATVKYDTVVK